MVDSVKRIHPKVLSHEVDCFPCGREVLLRVFGVDRSDGARRAREGRDDDSVNAHHHLLVDGGPRALPLSIGKQLAPRSFHDLLHLVHGDANLSRDLGIVLTDEEDVLIDELVERILLALHVPVLEYVPICRGHVAGLGIVAVPAATTVSNSRRVHV